MMKTTVPVAAARRLVVGSWRSGSTCRCLLRPPRAATPRFLSPGRNFGTTTFKRLPEARRQEGKEPKYKSVSPGPGEELEGSDEIDELGELGGLAESATHLSEDEEAAVPAEDEETVGEANKREKQKKELPPLPTPTYPVADPLPTGATISHIPMPILPERLAEKYAYIPYLCLAPPTGPNGHLDESGTIVPQPLPSMRDLTAADELFSYGRYNMRWTLLEHVRCISGEIPDVAVLGRARVGRETMIKMLAAEDIAERAGDLNWCKVGPVKVTQTTVGYGFSTMPLSSKKLPRFRLYDVPGWGHRQSARHIQAIAKRVLFKRKNCRGVVHMVSSAHGMRELDRQMMQQVAQRDIPIVVVLSKAQVYVPRPGEESFPAQNWEHLLCVAKGVYQAAAEVGARELMRGVYVLGSSSQTLDSRATGLLGVKYAIARLTGLLSQDNTWGRPQQVPAIEPLKPAESPLTEEFVATQAEQYEGGVKYLDPWRAQKGCAYARPEQDQERDEMRVEVTGANRKLERYRNAGRQAIMKARENTGKRLKVEKDETGREQPKHEWLKEFIEEMGPDLSRVGIVEGPDRVSAAGNQLIRENRLEHEALHGTSREQEVAAAVARNRAKRNERREQRKQLGGARVLKALRMERRMAPEPVDAPPDRNWKGLEKGVHKRVARRLAQENRGSFLTADELASLIRDGKF